MGRHQKGHIYEASKSFYLRYYTDEIVDGEMKRVQKSEWLCFKDDQHRSAKDGKVQLKRDEFMLAINKQSPGRARLDITVQDFWKRTYLPFAKENLRVSTLAGYQQIWNQHLEPHFGDLLLKQYKTHMGSQFLTTLSKTLGRRTVAHVRNLASGIFTHAINVGLIESNPWHDVKILGKQKPVKPTQHYTLQEARDIISALSDRIDAQLVMALAFFLGLRPGEIAGLKWEDVSAGWIHIQRAIVHGKVGETKTEESVARLPLINPVLVPLQLWHQKSGKPSSGWMFENKFGNPVDLKELVRRVIRPILNEKKIQWKTLYAGRRGAGTILTELTGSAIAAQQILRHKNLAVTTGFYVKAMPEAGLSGMKLLEAAAENHSL